MTPCLSRRAPGAPARTGARGSDLDPSSPSDGPSAKWGVDATAKPSVAAQCDIRINHGDLTALLYTQGYAAAEHVDDS